MHAGSSFSHSPWLAPDGIDTLTVSSSLDLAGLGPISQLMSGTSSDLSERRRRYNPGYANLPRNTNCRISRSFLAPCLVSQQHQQASSQQEHKQAVVRTHRASSDYQREWRVVYCRDNNGMIDDKLVSSLSLIGWTTMMIGWHGDDRAHRTNSPTPPPLSFTTSHLFIQTPPSYCLRVPVESAFALISHFTTTTNLLPHWRQRSHHNRLTLRATCSRLLRSTPCHRSTKLSKRSLDIPGEPRLPSRIAHTSSARSLGQRRLLQSCSRIHRETGSRW